MVDSVSVRFKNARVEKVPLNIRIQWNAGTACVSECVLKTLACRGLRVKVESLSCLACSKSSAEPVLRGGHAMFYGLNFWGPKP